MDYRARCNRFLTALVYLLLDEMDFFFEPHLRVGRRSERVL